MAKIFGIMVTLMVAVVIVAGLFIIGSPSRERERRFDNLRVNDLRQISTAVDHYYSSYGHLPGAINDLVKPEVARLYYIRSIKDPETSVAYEYTIIGNSEYKLCAKFAYSNIETLERKNVDQNDKAWAHPAGNKCFDLIAPPSKKVK